MHTGSTGTHVIIFINDNLLFQHGHLLMDFICLNWPKLRTNGRTSADGTTDGRTKTHREGKKSSEIRKLKSNKRDNKTQRYVHICAMLQDRVHAVWACTMCACLCIRWTKHTKNPPKLMIKTFDIFKLLFYTLSPCLQWTSTIAGWQAGRHEISSFTWAHTTDETAELRTVRYMACFFHCADDQYTDQKAIFFCAQQTRLIRSQVHLLNGF